MPTSFGPAESGRYDYSTPAPTVSLTRTLVYSYDNLYRLITATCTTGESYAYEYDPVGNRLKQIINGNTTTYLYDAANRLSQVNGQAYTFDNNGNLKLTGAMTNTFDAANRLISANRNGVTVQPIYNGVGDRVGQTVGTTTTHFALDVEGLPEVIYTSTGEVYLHLPGVIVTQKGGEVRYLLSDGLGSIRQAVDESRAVVAYNDFDPYGNPVQNGSQPYGFTGEWWQDEVDLLHLRARWYLPGTGAFLSRDPVESEPPYLYVRGNPINKTDPSGFLPPDYTRLFIEATPCGNSGKGKCDVHPVVRFIINRIHEDAASQEIRNIRALNETHYYEDALAVYEQMSWWQQPLVGSQYLLNAADLDAAARSAALAQFGCLVADARSRPVCGRWDYKREIGDQFQNSQTIDFCSIGRDEKVTFYYDIWANIHFGYLGTVGGFSEETLLTGADIEQAVSIPGQVKDDSSDQVAAKIGISLYRGVLTELTLLQQVYMHKDKLHKARRNERGEFEIYQ